MTARIPPSVGTRTWANRPGERSGTMGVQTAVRPGDLRGDGPGSVSRLDGEMVELSLLLPLWQVEVLETAARGQGLTAGQMLRRIIGDSLPKCG